NEFGFRDREQTHEFDDWAKSNPTYASLEPMVRRLNELGIAFYPVSAEGLETYAMSQRGFSRSDVRGFPMAPNSVGANSNAEVQRSAQLQGLANSLATNLANTPFSIPVGSQYHEFMRRIAERTGGRAFFNDNDLVT